MIQVVASTKHRLQFDVKDLPPKHAIALNAAMEYDVETMRIHIVNVNPKTNTHLDPHQWAQRLGQIPLDSSHVLSFTTVKDCNNCKGQGCGACGAELQLHITNESLSESLNVYSDDLVSSDPRVRPTNRSFFATFKPTNANSVYVETTEAHTFDEGDLVNVIENTIGLPSYGRATNVTKNGLTLVPLFKKGKFGLSKRHTAQQGRISNRLLLYKLAPQQSISFTALAIKGTGRDWVKWSPCWSHYRPLFRDNRINRELAAQLSPKQRDGLRASCPRQVFDIESDEIVIARPDDCDACRQCTDWATQNDIDGVIELSKRKKPEWQRFTVETMGSLDAHIVVTRAIDIIMSRLHQVSLAASNQLLYPALPSRRR